MAEIIKAANIKKSFLIGKQTIKVIKGIDISIGESESMAIVGPSGSGKSTLLHILGLLSSPDEGELYFEGNDVLFQKENSRSELRNKYIGFIFQFHYLLPEFNIIDNIMMPFYIKEKEVKQKYKEKALKLADALGLSERINHRPAEISGGEQQRVAIARAMINEPKLILADEPTGNLDSETAGNISDLMVKLCKEYNKAVILVTHNENLAKKMDKIYFLKDGRIVQ